MRKRRTIKKIVLLGAGLVAVGGLMTLLLAADSRKGEERCRDVRITIRGSGENYYIEKDDILKKLQSSFGNPVGKPVSALPLDRMEKSLEGNAWVQDAELYLDSRNTLHVNVRERQPVVRVFTTAGNSFYLDSAGYRMPLLEGVSARLPVVTGFTAAKKWGRRDSALLMGVKSVATFINGHPFWSAQVGQIDLTREGGFELVPTVGNHIIRLGDATELEEKLGRLYVFYRQVLSKTGFDKYSLLDVQFDGQVVAVNKGAASAVDSIQLQKNIEELLLRSHLREAEAVTQAPLPVADTAVRHPLQTQSAPMNNPPAAVQAVRQSSNPAKPAASRPVKSTDRKPKAVMKKRSE